MNQFTQQEPNSYLALQAFVRRMRFVFYVIPPLLIVPLLWYSYAEMLRSTAKVQLVVEIAQAGLLNYPGIRKLAETMLNGNAAFSIFLVVCTVVMVLCIMFAARAKLVSHAAATQLAYENDFASIQVESRELASAQDAAPVLIESVTPYYPETNEDWKKHAHPLQMLSIQAQGTRHTSREEMIAQLETALARLKAGDVEGEESDDDFGYRFVEAKSLNYSIFKGM
jgi:hypothetical protein